MFGLARESRGRVRNQRARIYVPHQDAPVCGVRPRSTWSTFSQPPTLASEFVSGRTFADDQDTAMLRVVVERRCEMIDEALAKLAIPSREYR